MRELERILALWNHAKAASDEAVLATVVETKGSSYRLPGARLLLTSAGQKAGAISGGCLEEELTKKAFWHTQHGTALRRYDTNADGEIGPGFGLGCNGVIDVLLERLQPGEPNILDVISRVRKTRRVAIACHVLTPVSNVGQRLIMESNGQLSNTLTVQDGDEVEAEARIALSTHRSQVVQCTTSRVFVETLQPAVRLLIFGAGDDAIPLTEMAAQLGWRTIVYDGRSHYARRDKFPQADQVAVWPSPERETDFAIDPWTVAVLMTHSYSQDLRGLRALAGRKLPYVGILGPRKRSAQLLKDAALEETAFGGSLHSPIGLDLGADGPEQVALAVVAEIQATLNHRQGGLLRDGHGSIHAPDSAAPQQEQWNGSVICA